MEQPEPKLMRWWRVDLNKDGSVKSCEEVEETSKQGRHVRFVEASTKVAACLEAKSWYERRKSSVNSYCKKRHHRLREAGLCSICGKLPLATSWYCRPCADRKRDRRIALERGEPTINNMDGDTERIRQQMLEYARNRTTYHRITAKAVFGFELRPFQIKHIKRLLDELGPERFRAKLCEVVPDEPAERVAEAAE